MEEALQHDQATQLFGISATRTRGAVSSQLANVNKLTNLTLAPLQGAGQIAYFRLVSNDTKADFGYFVMINAGGIRCWTNDSQIDFKRSL